MVPALKDVELQRALRHVYTEPGSLPELRAQLKGAAVVFPLRHTQAAVDIVGDVARVEVTQTFANAFEEPLEAIYIFPLPENAAVDGMKMIIGERTIEASIEERKAARQTYQTAKQNGHTAALLEQERPNVFTQSIANIAPRTEIKVVTRYLQPLAYDGGWYELVFPMVVGPRFIPGEPNGKQGSGYSADTTQVPDASRISPPLMGKGERTGSDISIAVTARTGLPIGEYEVPTHDVIYRPTFDGSLQLELSPQDRLPNRDFVLRYRVDGEKTTAAVLADHGKQGGFVSLVVAPPKLDIDAVVGSREMIFVVDVSGSMHGVPLAMCQDAMREALRRMRPVDTFNVITFAGSTGRLFPASRPANEANLFEAQQFVTGLKAAGGTMMGDGVKEALRVDARNADSTRHRHVFFMTDGYVGNEAQILVDTKQYVKAFASTGGRARVFGFGVGSSVNRFLLDGLGKEGDGLTVYATTREDPVTAVNKFYRYVDKSILENVTIDWGGLDVVDAQPSQLPDLFASRPLVVRARYAQGGKATIHVKGTAQGKAFDLPILVDLASAPTAQPALATLWARAKAESYERDMWSGGVADTEQKLTQLGLQFGIVTRFTSLVAVDRSSKVDGQGRTIVQPVEEPEGVDGEMAGAGFGKNSLGGLGLRGTGAGGGGYSVGGAGLGRSVAKSIAPSPTIMERAMKKNLTKGEAMGYGAGQGSLGAMTPRAVKDDSREAAKPSKAPREESVALADETEQRVRQPKPEPKTADVSLTALLSKHQPTLRTCLEQGAQAASGQKFSLRMTWFVSADGKLLQLHAMGAARGTDIEACFIKVMREWRLPELKTNFAYEWTFTR